VLCGTVTPMFVELFKDWEADIGDTSYSLFQSGTWLGKHTFLSIFDQPLCVEDDTAIEARMVAHR
jgi:hypothetical protein